MNLLPHVKRWLEQLDVENVKDSNEGLTCSCPFHSDNKPSFTMNGHTGMWVCWSGSCPYGQGNIVQFLVYAFGMSYKKAMTVASELPVSVDFDRIEKLPLTRGKRRDEQIEAMQESLLGLYARAPRYLLNRGFTKQTLSAFEVGYDSKTDYAVIPVRDLDARLVGISKRACSEQQTKWVHENFQRGSVLFNAHQARWDRREVPFKKAVGIGVEGQLDCLWLHQQGYRHSVSTLSAVVTDIQIDLIARCFSKFIVFFDSDEGGYTGAYYVTKRLMKRLPVKVARYPQVSKDEFFTVGAENKIDPSRLDKDEIKDILHNHLQDGLEFIVEAAPVVDRQKKKKQDLRDEMKTQVWDRLSEMLPLTAVGSGSQRRKQ